MTIVRQLLVLAAFGAVVGPVLDFAHFRTGAIGYLTPVTFGVPWWVVIVYACAAVGIGGSHPRLDRLLGRRQRVPLTPALLVAGVLALFAIWIASGLLPFSSGVVSAILAVASLGVWAALDRTAQGLALGAGTAAAGVLVEVVLVKAGLFYHAHADVLGVALWLPWLYVAGSVAIGNVGRRLAATAP
jgi:hypothetical protein